LLQWLQAHPIADRHARRRPRQKSRHQCHSGEGRSAMRRTSPAVL
jgi:hypothetical protein